MRVEIRTGDRIDLGGEARASAERCLLMALGRFAPRIASVTLTVEDAAPGARAGGITHQVVVHVAGARRFLVLEVDRDVVAAIARAADRARRCVERDVRREGPSATRSAGPRRAGRPASRRRVGQEPVTVAADRARKDQTS